MIKIIPMKINHIDQIYEIEKNSFSVPWSKDSFIKDLDNFCSIYYVAMDNDEVVGYMGMWHIVTEGHITNVAVKESHRKMGIGTKLISKMLEIGEEKEMLGITLEVSVANIPAINLYEKFGFKKEGIRKEYYEVTNEDAWIMWKYFNYDN